MTTSNAGRASATAAAFICMGLGQSGIFVGSFAVFLPVVSTSIGGGTTAFTLILTVAGYVSAVILPFGGHFIDRIGVRIPATMGVTFFALGLFLLSQIHSTGLAYWLAAICVGIGAALGGPVAYVRVISSWFGKNRALALGFVLAIAPQLSAAAVAPVAHWLIKDHGWRTTYIMLAAVVLLFGGLSALFFLKQRPSVTTGETRDVPPSLDEGTTPLDEGMTPKQVYRSRAFWTLTVADCLAVATLIGTQTHLVSWLTSRGTSADSATALVSVVSIAGMVGVVVSGFAADRARSQRVIVLLYAMPPLGLACLLVAGNNAALQTLGAILAGAGLSTVTMLLPYLVTRYFGMRASAEIYGVSLGLNLISLSTGPLLISMGYDATGSYALPMSLAVAATVISLLAMSMMPRFTYSATVPAPEPPANVETTS